MASVTKAKSRCWCFSLNTWGEFIGIFGLVASIIRLYSVIIPSLKTINETEEHVFNDYYKITPDEARSLFAGLIAYEVIEILHHSLLWYGTLMGKHLFLLPWLLISVLKLTLIGMFNIFLIAIAQFTQENNIKLQLYLAALCSSIIFVLYFHIISSISKLYIQIRKKPSVPMQIDTTTLL